ncbi:cytochrome D1 domain-containing protein, partial [Oleiphilus sp. HI0061]
MRIKSLAVALLSISLGACTCLHTQTEPRATGDMGVIIERATGSVKIIDTSDKKPVGSIDQLGDLSHASVVFSRDERYAYVFGRDGGLSKIDILTEEISKRVIQSGNSIGGAISQDGSLVAVSNYTPGGVKVFDSETL